MLCDISHMTALLDSGWEVTAGWDINREETPNSGGGVISLRQNK